MKQSAKKFSEGVRTKRFSPFGRTPNKYFIILEGLLKKGESWNNMQYYKIWCLRNNIVKSGIIKSFGKIPIEKGILAKKFQKKGYFQLIF